MRVLLLLRGSPGCGKTTWIQQNGLTNYAVSADDIRMMCTAPAMFPDGSVKIAMDSDKFVWDMLFKVVENRMRRGDFTVIDATNSKTAEMNRYKKLCQDYRYRIYCVDFKFYGWCRKKYQLCKDSGREYDGPKDICGLRSEFYMTCNEQEETI